MNHALIAPVLLPAACAVLMLLAGDERIRLQRAAALLACFGLVVVALGALGHTSVGTIAVFGAYAVRARRLWAVTGTAAGQPEQNQRFMVRIGLTLLGLFTMFVLFVAAPAVGTSLC